MLIALALKPIAVKTLCHQLDAPKLPKKRHKRAADAQVPSRVKPNKHSTTMSQVANKSLLLSQPKSGQTEGTPVPSLPYVSTLTDTATEIKIEIPGVDPSTVDVNFEDNTLSVTCDRGELTLPVNPSIDTSGIKADILWGMLTLSIPLPTPPESRSIKVSVHDAVKKSPTKLTSGS